MVEIKINNQSLELADDKELTYTLQVNDIADVATRQASYTNSFKIPKTHNNTVIMQGLGLVGDTSRIPYQKPNCELLDSGFSIIPNGWANIKNTDDNYSLYIYNGVIDFFKAIENKTLGTHLDLSEINHNKTVQAVVDSFTANKPYCYLVADYNGKTHYDVDNKININYLPPSASVEYLWKKIFSTFGFEYTGAIFDSEKFKNLWLTYPKGVAQTETQPIEIYNVATGLVPNSGLTFENGVFTATEQIVLKIIPEYVTEAGTQATRIYVNDVLVPNTNASPLLFDVEVTLLVGDEFYAMTYITNGNTFFDPLGVISVLKLGASQNFSEELKDFKITDFFKEVLNMFCLTMFPNNHSNIIDFKTITERVSTDEIVDWTDKYVERKNETYIFDTYAQKNNFRYQYNDKEDTYNDGVISIENVNIKDATDVWKSVTYAPLEEFNYNFAVGSIIKLVKIFKQYDKEVSENNNGVTSVKYKPLSKRYYFQRKEQITETATFGSENLGTSTLTTSSISMANFNQLEMNAIIGLNYLPMQTILNDSRLHTISLALNIIDIMTLDFRKLYYFQQEQQYYLLNRVSFKNGDLSTAEFVRVKRNSIPTLPIPTDKYITIDSITVNGCVITVNYTTNLPVGTAIDLVCKPNDFGLPPINPIDPLYAYSEVINSTGLTNTATFTLEAGGFYLVNMSVASQNVYSNQLGFENNTSCIVNSPNNLTITGVTLLSQTDLQRVYKVDFTTDALLPRNIHAKNYKTPSGLFGGWSNYENLGATNVNSINYTVSRMFGDAEKIQIRIGLTESNEFIL